MKKFKLFSVTLGCGNYDGRRFVLVVSGDGFFWHHVMRKPRTLVHDWRCKLAFWSAFLQVWPVYFVERSRDCDHVEATYRHRFLTYWHAHKYMVRAYEDAEGPKSFTQVNRKAYNEFEPEWHDRMLEAFENGRGTHTSIP